jgi:hypothetical protein
MVVVCVLALVLVGVFAATAAVVPSVCPAGFHVNGVVCLSDASHIAPSSGVRIPNAVILQRDPRLTLRFAIALAGLVLAFGMIGWERGTRRHAGDATSVAALT